MALHVPWTWRPDVDMYEIPGGAVVPGWFIDMLRDEVRRNPTAAGTRRITEEARLISVPRAVQLRPPVACGFRPVLA